MQQLELDKSAYRGPRPQQQVQVVPKGEVVAVVVDLMAKAMVAILRPSGEREVDDE